MNGSRPREPETFDDPDVDGFEAIVYRTESAIRNAYGRAVGAVDPVLDAGRSAFGSWWPIVAGLVGALAATVVAGVLWWLSVWLAGAAGLIGAGIALYVVLMVAHAAFRR